jgi:membrane protein YdbS with pleckstrin-like domain
MLSVKEEEFIKYWESARLQKKKVVKQLAVGLPLGVILVIAIFFNFFSGWYKRADMAMSEEDPTIILVLLVAAILIVVFVVIFSARHRWEMNEQHYKELVSRRDH